MTKTSTSSSESQYKKKSTPEGALIPQDNGTTSGEKSEAERLFDKIGTGAYYALRRPKDARVDRQLRRLISEANANGDCIINDGSGYFRPGEEDDMAAEAYFAQERHRAWEILHKISRMEEKFEERYQNGNV